MRHHIDLSKSPQNSYGYTLFASLWAILTVLILIVIKTYAFVISGSITVLGTLIDSIIDAVISVMLFFAVRLSVKPATKKHRHGHGKIEGVASLLQGSFMAGAGLFLVLMAINNLLNPQSLNEHKTTIIIAAIAVFLSFLIVMVQKYSLKRNPSLIIEADSAHYKSDIFLNFSVIISLVVHYYWGYSWVDPLLTFAIAGYFFFTAYKISASSLDILMDRELPDNVRMRIEQLVSSFPGIHGMHDLRTRCAGAKIYISFDVEIDPNMLLKEAHDIVSALDAKLLEHYPMAEVIIHMDPVGETEDPRHIQL